MSSIIHVYSNILIMSTTLKHGGEKYEVRLSMVIIIQYECSVNAYIYPERVSPQTIALMYSAGTLLLLLKFWLQERQ